MMDERMWEIFENWKKVNQFKLKDINIVDNMEFIELLSKMTEYAIDKTKQKILNNRTKPCKAEIMLFELKPKFYRNELRDNDYKDGTNHIIKEIFNVHKIEDCQTIGKGHPDFKVIKKNGQEFYVEVKQDVDKMSERQIEWCIKNPDKKYFILRINHHRDY